MPKVCIDAGHGGAQPGAVGNGLIEKNVVLDLALRVKLHLERNGIEVVMTRTGDSSVELMDRCRLANNMDCDLFVSLHINAGGGVGVGIWHSIADTTGTGGSKLANLILPNLVNAGFSNYGIHTRRGDDGRDYYCVIRETNMPAIIVEHGFIDNAGDAEKLKTESVLYKLADGNAKGITEYFGKAYIPQFSATYHTVVSGDTLWGIANKYGTTVDAIKKLNGLTSSTIYPGQKLRVK